MTLSINMAAVSLTAQLFASSVGGAILATIANIPGVHLVPFILSFPAYFVSND